MGRKKKTKYEIDGKILPWDQTEESALAIAKMFPNAKVFCRKARAAFNWVKKDLFVNHRVYQEAFGQPPKVRKGGTYIINGKLFPWNETREDAIAICREAAGWEDLKTKASGVAYWLMKKQNRELRDWITVNIWGKVPQLQHRTYVVNGKSIKWDGTHESAWEFIEAVDCIRDLMRQASGPYHYISADKELKAEADLCWANKNPDGVWAGPLDVYIWLHADEVYVGVSQDSSRRKHTEEYHPDVAKLRSKPGAKMIQLFSQCHPHFALNMERELIQFFKRLGYTVINRSSGGEIGKRYATLPSYRLPSLPKNPQLAFGFMPSMERMVGFLWRALGDVDCHRVSKQWLDKEKKIHLVYGPHAT